MTNGGFVQLPCPKLNGRTSISWDEYKAQTGIDLNDIFEAVDLEGGKDVNFRKDLNKPTMICGYAEATGDIYHGAPPDCGFPNIYEKFSVGTIEHITIGIGNREDSYWGISVGADKTISVAEM